MRTQGGIPAFHGRSLVLIRISLAHTTSRGSSAAMAGDSGSGGSIPSSATGNSDETTSVDEHSMMMAAMNNNNNLDNGMSEICDVPDHVANQKRHVSMHKNWEVGLWRGLAAAMESD